MKSCFLEELGVLLSMTIFPPLGFSIAIRLFIMIFPPLGFGIAIRRWNNCVLADDRCTIVIAIVIVLGENASLCCLPFPLSPLLDSANQKWFDVGHKHGCISQLRILAQIITCDRFQLLCHLAWADASFGTHNSWFDCCNHSGFGRFSNYFNSVLNSFANLGGQDSAIGAGTLVIHSNDLGDSGRQ